MTKDVTDTSFGVSWAAAPGNVRQYRIRWKSLFSEESGEKTIPGATTATVLDGLTPETRYQVSVAAVYGHGEGQALDGEEITDSKLHFPLELTPLQLKSFEFMDVSVCSYPETVRLGYSLRYNSVTIKVQKDFL